ncbi:MAG: DUF2304 domain-containing protein [Micropruina sp.]|nr:DUF2304 domain-containing protein [Micropruina sp.]
MNFALLAPIAVVLVFVGRIAVLLRRRQIREKYVWGWLALALAIAIIGLVPGLAVYLTEFFGFQLPSNMILGGAVLLLLFIAFNQSVEISRLDNDRRRLVEESAISDLKLRQLADRVATLEASEDPVTAPVRPEPLGSSPAPSDELPNGSASL